MVSGTARYLHPHVVRAGRRRRSGVGCGGPMAARVRWAIGCCCSGLRSARSSCWSTMWGTTAVRLFDSRTHCLDCQRARPRERSSAGRHAHGLSTPAHAGRTDHSVFALRPRRARRAIAVLVPSWDRGPSRGGSRGCGGSGPAVGVVQRRPIPERRALEPEDGSAHHAGVDGPRPRGVRAVGAAPHYKNVDASRLIGQVLPPDTLVQGKLANGLSLENRIRPCSSATSSAITPIENAVMMCDIF